MKNYSFLAAALVALVTTFSGRAEDCSPFLQSIRIRTQGGPGWASRTDLSLTKDSPSSYDTLKAATNLPLNSRTLSPRDQSSVDFWIDLDRYPAIISDQIHSGSSANLRDGREPDGFFEEFESCGTCKAMLPLHLRALVLPMLEKLGVIDHGEYINLDSFAAITGGKFVLVYVGGQLMGAVKALSAEAYAVNEAGLLDYDPERGLRAPVPTPTFLSFRNVQNSRGELVLAMGGVYYLPKAFLHDVFFPAINAQGPYIAGVSLPRRAGDVEPNARQFLNEFQFASVHVESLNLWAESFLFNDVGADARENRVLLDALFPESGTTTRAQFHSRWVRLLGTLDLIRNDFEARRESDEDLSDLRDWFRRRHPRLGLNNNASFWF